MSSSGTRQADLFYPSSGVFLVEQDRFTTSSYAYNCISFSVSSDLTFFCSSSIVFTMSFVAMTFCIIFSCLSFILAWKNYAWKSAVLFTFDSKPPRPCSHKLHSFIIHTFFQKLCTCNFCLLFMHDIPYIEKFEGWMQLRSLLQSCSTLISSSRTKLWDSRSTRMNCLIFLQPPHDSVQEIRFFGYCRSRQMNLSNCASSLIFLYSEEASALKREYTRVLENWGRSNFQNWQSTSKTSNKFSNWSLKRFWYKYILHTYLWVYRKRLLSIV